MSEKDTNFEKQLAELEEIVEVLDQGESPLVELLQKYERGMTLAKNCREFLEKAELKIIEIGKQVQSSDEETEEETEED